MQVLAEMRAEITAGEQRLTCADYRPREPLLNAKVFTELSDWQFVEVCENGMFCAKESAGVHPFRTLVTMLMETDLLHRLDRADAEEAVAMVYHLTPGVGQD